MAVGSTKVHQRYRLKSGKIVPGVTTVLALLAKPALIHWSWKLGIAGEDYKKVRDKAADIGSAVHYLAECHIKGTEPDMGDFTRNTVETAEFTIAGLLEWMSKKNLENVESEFQFVSEDWEYGGTIDWVAIDKDTGLRWMYDLKTSKGVYDEHRYQLAAYVFGWQENRPDEPIDRVAVLHLDKETGHLTEHPIGKLDTEFEIFKHLRSVYALQKQSDPNRDKGRNYRRLRRATDK